jgi:hypothetical protein
MGDKFYEDLVRRELYKNALNVVRKEAIKISHTSLNPLANTISLVMSYNSTPLTPRSSRGTRE